MKKRILSLLLTAALTSSLAPAASALGAFADVTDAETAQNVEVLRLMGVLEGNGAGAFYPNNTLTRAEFCKMAVALTGKRGVVSRYGSRTVFPDARGHWAAGYINYAASKEAGLIHGMPDGTFAPNRAITCGEAVAILTRLLGYSDADTGGIWPDGYLTLAGEAGMTRGLRVAGSATMTRAQAAKLFVNALSSENTKKEKLSALLGYTQGKSETVFYSVDLANGKLRTKDGDFELVNPMDSSALNGRKGYVLTDASGKAVTFLPSISTAASALSDAAVMVSADGSAAGLDALTGDAGGYSFYRNGVPVTLSALKKGDVVIYNAASNAMLACDTRVAVYYENCAPSPEAPDTVTVLGGTKFTVLPTARQSLSRYRPGQNMTLLLAADGSVAGATDGDANAYAYVGADGKVSLLCGASLLPIAEKPGENLTMNGSDVLGELVRVTQSGSSAHSAISLSKQSGASGDLDPVKGTVGARRVADGALVIHEGRLTSLAALGKAVIPQERISFTRLNSAGAIDLIAIKDNSGEFYGRATVTNGVGTQWITIESGADASVKKESYYSVRSGEFVSFRYNSDKSNYTELKPLTKLVSVSASAWVGERAVNYGDRTYTVSDRVICYNRDSGSWFDSLETAKAYGGKMDLYVKDGCVHAVEVHS